jgi:hypothetical protein
MKSRIGMCGTFALIVFSGMAPSWVRAQTTQPADDAAVIYSQAAKIVGDDSDLRNVMSPGSSALDFRGYPPMSDEWIKMEKLDYDRHGEVRDLVHRAALLTYAAWPTIDRQKIEPKTGYLRQSRWLANDIGDAALYESVILKNQPAAFQSAGDVMHLADLLENQSGEILVRLLVAAGIESLDMHQLMVMVSGARITEDAGNTHDLPLATARDWITRLQDYPDAQVELDRAIKGKPAGTSINPISKQSAGRVIEIIRRLEVEKDMASMSLAAHVYQYKHGRWPGNLAELESELPRVLLDPWGDGKQVLGYVLIKGGLPDGTDRPMVYTRFRSKDGLFFRTDEPQYSIYNADGSDVTTPWQKQEGQFRDVARWAPPEAKESHATTEALP